MLGCDSDHGRRVSFERLPADAVGEGAQEALIDQLELFVGGGRALVGGHAAQNGAGDVDVPRDGPVILFENAALLTGGHEPEQPHPLQLAYMVVDLGRGLFEQGAELGHRHGAAFKGAANPHAQLVGDGAQLLHALDVVDLRDVVVIHLNLLHQIFLIE